MDVSVAAERVRMALRNAGHQEFEPGRRGFLAEGDPNGGWVSVRCHPGFPWASRRRDRDLQSYRDILHTAGFTVTDSPWVRGSLRVAPPGDAVPAPAGGIPSSSRERGTAKDFVRSHKVLSIIIAALVVFAIVNYIGNYWWW
jgi:hypothetical protein